MRTLLLNSPADHASRAFIDQKTTHPDQVPLLVDNHRLGETKTPHQQATGIKKQKNSERNAHYLLNIPTSGTKRLKQATGAHQKISERFAHYLLTIRTRRHFFPPRTHPLLTFISAGFLMPLIGHALQV